MTDRQELDSADHQVEMDTRRLLDAGKKAEAEGFQLAANWYLAVKRGEIKVKFRRLLLVDGLPAPAA